MTIDIAFQDGSHASPGLQCIAMVNRAVASALAGRYVACANAAALGYGFVACLKHSAFLS